MIISLMFFFSFYSCWLSRIPFYAAFLAPVCVILILNVVVFILVMKQICGRASKKLSKSTQKSNISQQLKGAVVLLVMLGLTWTIAFLAVSEATLPFQIAFTCLNGFQGFFIFLFHCVFKSDVRNLWKKKVFGPASEATKTSKGKYVTVDLYNGNLKLYFYHFYTPVFGRDVLWYGDVRPSVRPGLRPSVTVFHTFLLHALTY